MLAVRDLSVRYGKHLAVDGVSLDVARDEIVVILGANGAGKSSLLKAIAGMSEGEVSGRIEIDGASIAAEPAERIVARGVAFVPEGRGIFGDMTVDENLELGAWTPSAANARVASRERVFSLFPKLAERRRQRASTMSGGEQQMVAIGRALMSNPRVLMLDEPSLGLSPLLCKELFRSLASVRDGGMSVLLVEQNARQSLAIADRACLLETGSITGQGSAAAMASDPAVQSAYLGGAAAARSAAIEPIAVAAPADPLVGIDIGALVARAAGAARPAAASTDIRARDASAWPSSSASPVSPRALPATRSAPSPPSATSSTPATPADDELERLLHGLERAAAGARRPHPPARSADNEAASRRSSDTALEPEALPTIPVYRRRAVRVFTRDARGRLTEREPSR